VSFHARQREVLVAKLDLAHDRCGMLVESSLEVGMREFHKLGRTVAEAEAKALRGGDGERERLTDLTNAVRALRMRFGG
jgi:hypothetical protein